MLHSIQVIYRELLNLLTHMKYLAYCEEGIESDILTLYNVQQLPTYFLIDRNCDLKSRQEDPRTLSASIEKLL